MSLQPDVDFAPLRSCSGALVVALSGGLDSIVLLHLLAGRPEARQRGLSALHVHHGLHPEADAWQAHCEALCATLGVPLSTVRVSVEPAGQGPEAAAREARFAAFAAALQPDGVLALAHHRDDQAETFLLRALRASGPDGLRAMRPWRPLGRGWLWRPLLQTPRAALLDYAQAHRLAWIDDPSNEDDRFDRNFLRTRVLPLLRERWPHADAAFARSAALCAAMSDLLDSDDAALLASIRTGRPDVLDLETLRRMSPDRRARLLRRWIMELHLPPLPADAIRRAETELLHARADALPRIDWHGASLRAWCGQLHAGIATPPLDADLDAAWNGRAPLRLPDGGVLAVVPPVDLPSGTRVQSRRGGERIQLPGRRHTHALKHVLQALRVPPWTRDHVPLLVDDEGVLAAGDIAVGAHLSTLLASAGASLVWTRPDGA